MNYRNFVCKIYQQNNLWMIENIEPSFIITDNNLCNAIEYWKQEIDYKIREQNANNSTSKSID